MTAQMHLLKRLRRTKSRDIWNMNAHAHNDLNILLICGRCFAPGLSLRSAVDNACGWTLPPTGLPTARPFARKLHRPFKHYWKIPASSSDFAA